MGGAYVDWSLISSGIFHWTPSKWGIEGGTVCVVQGSWGGDCSFFLSSSLDVSFPQPKYIGKEYVCSQHWKNFYFCWDQQPKLSAICSFTQRGQSNKENPWNKYFPFCLTGGNSTRLDKPSVQDAHGRVPLGFQISGQEYPAYDLDQRKTQPSKKTSWKECHNFH